MVREFDARWERNCLLTTQAFISSQAFLCFEL
jgi:hypothetical protein